MTMAGQDGVGVVVPDLAIGHGIPPIAPYEMPVVDLAGGGASWRPRADRTALLIHDMQHYFLAPFVRTASPARELIRNARLLRDACTARGVPVAYTAQPGGMSRAERGLLADFWGAGMSAAPEHRRIVDELHPGERDVVFTKWRYSAFHRSGLLSFLRREGRDQLLICGVFAHVGCLMSAQDAFANDIEPFLIADATADFSAQHHASALEYAAARCAAVQSTATVLAELDASS
jgi:isochorismate hydrolase